jgi:4-diphosphocytidyl-2-C-methyl-D-erythritol kinase
VFRLIDRSDRVGIEVTRAGEIRRIDETPGVEPESDLCLRAARLLREAAIARLGPEAATLGVEIGLEKNLPIGGGLGGGSSDAATVLLVLNRLWGVGFAREELMALGLQLGADVPVFLFGESALGEGVGERLTPLSLAPAWYLVLVPQVSVSTKEIFSSGALTRDTKPLKMLPFLPLSGKNDLQVVATALYPAVAEHLEWLSKHGDARMTGSGACVFAEFATEARARAVEAMLQGGMRGFVARGLDRHPLHQWAEGG